MKRLPLYPDLSQLLLRLAVGATFLVYGFNKWGFWTNPAMTASSMTPLFQFLAIAEPIGALALIVGLLSRTAAACLAIIMIGAIFLKITQMHLGFSSPGGYSLDLVLLAACLSILFTGPGKYSVKA